MEDSYEHLQRGSVQSVSRTVDDTYEQLELSVQPTQKRQMQSATTRTVKVILGLLGAVVLVALAVAVMAAVLHQQHNSKLMKKIFSLEQMMHRLQDDQTKSTGTELSLSSSKGTSSSTSPATPVPTASSPATPVPTASSPSTTVSHTDSSLTSCAAIHSSDPSAPSGVYTIHIGGSVQGRAVWCDMVTDGGGWTRFQRRQDGTVEFNRTWSEYKTGFGSAYTEFWLGNDDLHTLTSALLSELRVDLWDWKGNHRYATYSTFGVDGESTDYVIHFSGYNGTAGDSLWAVNSRPFTTIDRDHDTNNGNCANSGGGGWWFENCSHSNLNGWYYPDDSRTAHGVLWGSRGVYSQKAASMMTRPRR